MLLNSHVSDKVTQHICMFHAYLPDSTDVMQYNTAQHSVALCSEAQFNATQYSALTCSAEQHN